MGKIIAKPWEFDSHLDVSGRLMQVWSRPSKLAGGDIIDYTVTEDTPGKENYPHDGCGYWQGINGFKQSCPCFNRQ